MSKQDDGGPAFPNEGNGQLYPHPGMSLRDYFAAGCMAAMIQKLPLFDREGENGKRASQDEVNRRLDLAESAYFYADAMLAARSA